MDRFGRLLDLMQDNDLSAVLIQDESNIFYFTGFKGSGYLVVPIDGKAKLYVHPINYETAQLYAVGEIEIEKLRMSSSLVDVVAGLSDVIKYRMGYDKMEAEDYVRILEGSHVERLQPFSEQIWKLRMVKDEEEVSKIKKASEIASKCMELASDIIADGISELEVKAEILEEMLKLGAERPAFDPIIASGPRSSLPHGGLGDRVMKEGDVVVVDIGAVVDGYCSDMTRTFYIGSNPPREVEEAYELILNVKRAAEETAKPWIISSSIDEAARNRVAAHGMGDYFIHNLGHGVGIDIHEPPKLSPTSKEIIQERTVITIEPGVYFPRRFGVRLEDTVLVHREGVQRLTESPYNLALY